MASRASWRVVAGAALWLAGCAQIGGEPPTAESRATLEEAPRLVVSPAAAEAPAGSDAPASYEAAWRDAQGRDTPLAVPGPFLSALAWNAEAVVVDQARGLWAVSPGGRRRQLGLGVIGTPAVSDDGLQLAYVEARDLGCEVLVRRPSGGPRVAARGLASAGALRFAPDGERLLLVGSRPGGVAGLHVARVAQGGEAICLSNCQLRAGRPLGEGFVPLPAAAGALEFDGDEVSWDAGGSRASARLGPGVPP